MFPEKTAKNCLWEYMTVLRRKRRLATKNHYNLFCRKSRFQLFSRNNFFGKENSIFQTNHENQFFGGMTIFEGMGRRMTKMNNFFCGKWGREYGFKVFSWKTPIPAEWKLKTHFWGYIFPYICNFILPIISKNNRVNPWVNLHQPCEFHENWFKTAAGIIPDFKILFWISHLL